MRNSTGWLDESIGTIKLENAYIFRIQVQLVENRLASAIIDKQFHNDVGFRDGHLFYIKFRADGLQ